MDDRLRKQPAQSEAYSYVAITPARNEAANLRRLGRALARQSVLPAAWLIVDDASTDDTAAVAAQLAREHPWVRVLGAPPAGDGAGSGRWNGRDVVAFHAAVTELDAAPDIVLKLDADVSVAPEYFERLLGKFAADPALGIASGTCYERRGDRWRAYPVRPGHVRGATRAWRWECFLEVGPLEQRLGWDVVDALKANVRGWRTTSFADLHFYHHRPLGARDGSFRSWLDQGRTAHFLGYRPTYLLFRVLYRAWRSPNALAMLAGYVLALARREPRQADEGARAYLRRQQELRGLVQRVHRALVRA